MIFLKDYRPIRELVDKTLVIGLIFTNNERWNRQIPNAFVFSSTKTFSTFVDSEEPFLPYTYESKKLYTDRIRKVGRLTRAKPCLSCSNPSIPGLNHVFLQNQCLHKHQICSNFCLQTRVELACPLSRADYVDR